MLLFTPNETRDMTASTNAQDAKSQADTVATTKTVMITEKSLPANT